MLRTIVWVRLGLVLILATLCAWFGIASHSIADRRLKVEDEPRRQADAAARFAMDTYSMIEELKTEEQVERVLGTGEVIEGPEWTKVLGELPEYKGYTSRRPVRWKRWPAPGEMRWIAVAFISVPDWRYPDGPASSFVVSKKCGNPNPR